MKRILLILSIALILSSCAKAITGNDVVTAFKAANLEAENSRQMVKDDYGFAPYVCKGTRFYIPSLGPDNGGRIFVCDNPADRDLLAKYYNEMGRQSAALFSWVFVKGNVIVQINGDLSEQLAKKYETAIP
jgi:hypothetical protein